MDTAGNQFHLNGAPIIADTGRGAYEGGNVFGSLLTFAWMADYAVARNGRRHDEIERCKFIVDSIEKDMPALHGLGIRGKVAAINRNFVLVDPRLITWEELKVKYQNRIKRLEDSESRPDSQKIANPAG